MKLDAAERLAHLSYREKIGFALGDLGFNLYWASIAAFLAVFYTEVVGISVAAAGTLFFVTKIIDALTDPLMGAIADRTHSRWGKFRPYLLFAGIPMAAAAVLTFSAPMHTESGKLIYAYISYSLMMLCYTVLSTPYSSLSGVMTAEPQARASLISFRFIAAFVGTSMVNKFTLPLVQFLGRGDAELGWQLTMLLYGAVATVLFALTFVSTRERIAPPLTQHSSPLVDVADLMRNRPWLILIALALVIMMTITMRAGSAYYYFTYFVQRPDLISNYLLVQGLALAAGAAITPLLTRYFDKTRLLIFLLASVGVLSSAFYFVPATNISLMFLLNILISFALGPKSPLAWSMYADTADYSEWKTGRRATAMTFSAATFAQKLGGALGSAVMLWVLAAMGYVASQAQSDASQLGVLLVQTLIPGLVALGAAVIVSFYPLTNNKLAQIQQDLVARSKAQPSEV